MGVQLRLRHRRILDCVMTALFVAWFGAAPALAAARPQDEEFLHGTGRFVGGTLLDLPRAVVDASSISPSLISAGIVAGTVRGAQVTFEGLWEMNRTFDPWGAKRSEREHRRRQQAPRPPGAFTTPGFSADP